jgi:hypothetical protein
MAHQPGSQLLLKSATEVNWMDDRVHIAAPVLRRERDRVRSLMPSSTINDTANIVVQEKTSSIVPDC